MGVDTVRDIPGRDIQKVELVRLHPDVTLMWLFSACYEGYHNICWGDADLPRGGKGQCVCGCHRKG